MWEILLSMLTRKDLQNKKSTIKMVYKEQHRIKVAVFEVSSFISGQQVGAFLMLYMELVEIKSDEKRRWKYHICIYQIHIFTLH